MACMQAYVSKCTWWFDSVARLFPIFKQPHTHTMLLLVGPQQYWLPELCAARMLGHVRVSNQLSYRCTFTCFNCFHCFYQP